MKLGTMTLVVGAIVLAAIFYQPTRVLGLIALAFGAAFGAFKILKGG